MTMTIPELIEWFEDSVKGADQSAEENAIRLDSSELEIYDTGYYRGRRDAWRTAANYLRQSYYLEARPKHESN